MSKWKLNFDSSCELVSDEKNICDQSISPQTLLTLGVPGVENHVYNFGTNYSSNPSIEKNSHKESRGKKRKCGEDLVYELDVSFLVSFSGVTTSQLSYSLFDQAFKIIVLDSNLCLVN